MKTSRTAAASASRAIVAIGLAVGLMATVRPAGAAAFYWDGDDPGNNWTTAANWTNNIVPANDGTAAIVFPVGKTTAPAGSNINVDSAQNITNLTINDLYTLTNSQLTLQSGAITIYPPAGTITINNNIVLGTNALWTLNGGTGNEYLKVNGVISDGGNGYSLTKAGDRYLDLTANNTYSGPTIFASGAGQTFWLRGTNATSGIICNGGTYFYVLGANNSVTGTVLNAGQVVVGQTNSLGNGPITFAGGTLAFYTNGLTLTNHIVVNGDLKLGIGPPNPTFATGDQRDQKALKNRKISA